MIPDYLKRSRIKEENDKEIRKTENFLLILTGSILTTFIIVVLTQLMIALR